MLLFLFLSLQETPARTEKGAGAQKTAHQEAAKRLHALHERDAGECGRRVHAEGERGHQSDPWTKGRCILCFCSLSLLIELNPLVITVQAVALKRLRALPSQAQLLTKVQGFLSLLTYSLL